MELVLRALNEYIWNQRKVDIWKVYLYKKEKNI